jgi:hypothetical protein
MGRLVTRTATRGARQPARLGRVLEHDPEKWIPVSEKVMLPEPERDDDSKKSHPALGQPRGRQSKSQRRTTIIAVKRAPTNEIAMSPTKTSG